MTRFIFLSDTHLGGTRDAWHQQPFYPERLPELLGYLRDWMAAHAPVDFVLHGGDMVHEATPANLAAAQKLFRLPAPVYLCLGNHDLTGEGALPAWLKTAPEFFPGGLPEFCHDAHGCSLYAMPSHWQERPYSWEDEQTPQFRPDQVRAYNAARAARPGGIDFFCTHSPVMGVPIEQTGLDEPYHAPPQRFVRETVGILERSNRTRCALGGHSHIHSCVERDGIRFVTTGSFVETPFEFKRFEVGDAEIRMTTHSLHDRVTFDAPVDREKAYVMGRPMDRAFSLRRRCRTP